MNVPVLDLKRQYAAIQHEIDAAILEVVRSGQYVLGPYVRDFENAAAEYCGCRHAIGVASGTDALLLSLKALGIGSGDSVILPRFTFFATAGVVHNVGATPVFCDIDPRTFNLDPEHLRSILEGAGAACGTSPVASGDKSRNNLHASSTSHTPRTTSSGPRFRAIIPVHLYGQIADMNEITSIADEYGLAVIEDAAQAIGAEYGPVAGSQLPVGDPAGSTPHSTLHSPLASGGTARAGTIGDLGCFSFYPTKNLGAYGDGGMITTNNDQLADKIRLLRVHGAKPKYYHKMVGINSRLDAIQAAVLSVKLPHLDAWSAARARIADQYDAALAEVGGIITPFRADARSHIFHQYTVRVLDGKRDALARFLSDAGIGTMIYYPVPLHLQECFSHLGYAEGHLPESERASRDVLSLPIFPELAIAEQAHVVKAIKAFMER
ncbi:DegT/DnrJ/EryC1/StrS family aminotransferase [Candidatus Bipolaricaulota bacterium]|nr:DegT/DnrJ/EryC1/StrS family aminotransferase [Candidatus Bipolaricaulota bacterium]